MSIRTLFRAGAVLGAVAGIGIVVYAATAITATTTTANVTAGANNQTFVSATTTANVTAGANNQTFVSATTTANVSQTKASLTLTVNSIPGYNASTTIGSCVVSYSTTSASSYNCSGNAATINTVTSNTVALLTTALASLTNVGSVSHGALAVTATTTTTVTFSTAGTETSATPIPFVDGTSNAVSSSASVTGVVPVAQVNTFTLGGTAESGDTYSLVLPTGTLSYLTVASDTSATNIAIDINATLQATSSYASLPYTSSPSGSTIVLTAKTAGTGFTAPAPSVTNRLNVAQVTTFSIPSITNSSTYGITINSNTYNFTGNTTGAVVSGLQAAMAGDPAVACTVSGSVITCTARVAGTPFSYSTSGTDVFSSSGSSGGGGSVRDQVAWLIANGNTKAAQAIEAQWPQLFGMSSLHSASSPGTNSGFMRNLSVGKKGADVKTLQIFLNAHGAAIAATGSGSAGHETTLFGVLTKKALAKYQKDHGLTPASGFFGPITRAYIENHP